ncbi:Mismatch repair ATPase MSH6 (MutS family) [Handroanthus impetiginosus]|uniref:Mismatch repair ATPase MSH6 (MutS family) n=1 Tax=Handroanthus impetiginosus TaxID=429701 RepID=A0A2G9FXB8_9LAMI|nr:Mismatch repair ATPase MSH6 (MutS family) [Handroanthus impetiginosus]
MVGDAAERFGAREAEKLRFLEVDRRDANRRRPGDINYDPRTLFLPPDFVKGLTGGQRQWWEFKSKHMDKVLFFKMGKFYELFEMDAHVGAKELGLQYMKGEQPHCGFPEKNFSMNVEKLARKGYRVLVVEQTETPEQLELRRREKGSKDKVVKREICAVVTKGTLTEGEMLSTNPDASFLIAVTENCQISANQKGAHVFGICLVDVATSKIILGQFRDDADCSSLCCLLSELRPVEIIKPAKLLCPETEMALSRHTRNPLVNELIPFSEFWDAEGTICEVTRIYQRVGNHSCYSAVDETNVQSNDSSLQNGGRNCLPDVLSSLVSAGENGNQALSALGGALFYLRQAYLDETLLRFAKFELLPCSGFGEITRKPYMILDAAALENLEIFENNRNGDSSGTLYAQLNHCATAFGKRLLRTWLARPLYHIESIKERQDAIAELKGVNQPHVLSFRKELSKLPDMERLLARIFAGSEGNGRNANKVVLYEDAAKKQLQEFISALRGCEVMTHACSSFGAALENGESRLLRHLLMPGIPDVSSILSYFKDAFDWEEANHSGRIIPREGADVEYDAACQMVKDIESKLKKHLKEQRKLLGDASICYVTVGKDAYLLEVPESLSQSIPKEYELRSSKKGFFRYWTPEIKRLIGQLSQAESEKESKLKSILQRLIGRFCENHVKWRQMVSTVAELDVLISLSIASEYYEGKTCCPILAQSHLDEVPFLSAKSLGHPVLRSDTLGEGTFVTNDVAMGGSDNASFILLTGPNMGGKSTLLRQVCLAVILAQIGADVPAESFILAPIDRIFVRMGAKDQIMAGHSTFLAELLETASMLASATRSSLVALDELGRGTSTSDGQAIAASVLEHFVRTVQCRGLFSTHYHRLAVDYQKDPKVSLCHMACQVGKGILGLEEVIFLYKLTPGACPKSYGVNVARLAGLPDTVLQKAAAKSQEFEASYGKRYPQKWEDKASLIINNLIKIGSINHCSTLTDIGSLADLQYRNRLLLEQC